MRKHDDRSAEINHGAKEAERQLMPFGGTKGAAKSAIAMEDPAPPWPIRISRVPCFGIIAGARESGVGTSFEAGERVRNVPPADQVACLVITGRPCTIYFG